MEIKHTIRIIDGKPQWENAELFAWDVSCLSGFAVVTVKGIRITRSKLMNAYYWSVVVPMIVKAVNEQNTLDRVVDKDFMHDVLKTMFLWTDEVTPPGHHESISVLAKSSELNNQEFIQFWENARTWALEFLGIDIPEPNKDFLEEADRIEAEKKKKS